jgi:hypothetical protein
MTLLEPMDIIRMMVLVKHPVHMSLKLPAIDDDPKRNWRNRLVFQKLVAYSTAVDLNKNRLMASHVLQCTNKYDSYVIKT